MADEQDRIERTIEINADPERVWGLISEPGWWINEGTVREHVIERDGDLSIVHDVKHGAFRIRTVELDRPHYAAFRWLSQDDAAEPEEFTLVEFWIQPAADGGVTVRVVESGFDSLNVSEQERRTKVEENTEGWEIELGAAKTFLST